MPQSVKATGSCVRVPSQTVMSGVGPGGGASARGVGGGEEEEVGGCKPVQHHDTIKKALYLRAWNTGNRVRFCCVNDAGMN